MKLLGLILGSLSFIGLLYCLIRLYVASRINRRHRFCEEAYGDVIELPAAAMSGGGTAARGSSRGTGHVSHKHVGAGN